MSERCAANAVAHVSVNGRQLVVADLSNHANTATFYGQGCVVRLDQRVGRVYMVAVTTDRTAIVVVWFTRFGPTRVG